MLSALRGSWVSWGVVAVATGCTLTDSWEPNAVGGDGIVSPGSGQGGSSGRAGSNQDGSEPGFGGNVPIAPGDGLGGANQTGAGNATGVGGAAGSGGMTDAGSEPLDAGEPQVTCPGLVFEASCYEFVAAVVTWDVAEAGCAQRNADLASVESVEEDTFLGVWPQTLGIPADNGSGIWLGATDALVDNDFRWPDNAPLTFNHWGATQPDNGAGAADCVEKRNEPSASWYDQRCTDVKPYICERPR